LLVTGAKLLPRPPMVVRSHRAEARWLPLPCCSEGDEPRRPPTDLVHRAQGWATPVAACCAKLSEGSRCCVPAVRRQRARHGGAHGGGIQWGIFFREFSCCNIFFGMFVLEILSVAKNTPHNNWCFWVSPSVNVVIVQCCNFDFLMFHLLIFGVLAFFSLVCHCEFNQFNHDLHEIIAWNKYWCFSGIFSSEIDRAIFSYMFECCKYDFFCKHFVFVLQLWWHIFFWILSSS
jgi:hypothetical protein